MFSFNPQIQSVAYMVPKGKLYLSSQIDCFSKQTSQIQGNLIYQTDKEITNLFWINSYTQLCLIEGTGKLLILDTSHHLLFSIQLEYFDMISPCFDDQTKILFYLTGDKLISIPFAFISPPYCYTSTSLYKLSNIKKIASIFNEGTSQFNEIAILPPDIFPISKVAESNSNEIAIYGGNCIVVLTDNKLFLTHIVDFTAMGWCKDKLYVFTTSKSNSSLIVYSRELMKIATIPSPHEATTISFANDRIVISNKNLFTVFDFDMNKIIKKPKESRFMSSSVESDEITLSTTTFKIPETILNAICSFYDDIWLLLKPNMKSKSIHEFNDLTANNNFVLNFHTNVVIDSNVDQIWSNTKPRLLFIEKPHTFKFYTSSKTQNSEVFEISKTSHFINDCNATDFNDIDNQNDLTNTILKDNAISIDGTNFVVSKSSSELTNSFQTCDYLIQILQIELNKGHISNCYSLLESMILMNDFNQIISQFFIYSFQSGHLSDFIKILSLFEIDQISLILSIFDKQLQNILASTCLFSTSNENNIIDTLLFFLLDVDLQLSLLINMTPDMFMQIINSFCKNNLIKNGNEYVSKLIHELLYSMEWSKLIRVVNLVSIQYQFAADLPLELINLNELNTFTINQTLGIIGRDHKKWLDYENKQRDGKNIEQKEVIKSLGISFIAADLYKWAISCFYVVNDINKCKILIMDKPELTDEINMIIDENQQAHFCLFMHNILKDIHII